MERSRTPELIGGIVLVIIGVAFLASYVVPDLGRYVVLAIGIGILVLFAATRVPAALIGGCIVTGVGAGVVLSSLIEGQTGGGLFLISLGAGFLLVWFAGRFLAFEETRVWPLIPGTILVLVGAALLPGAGWAVALIVIGAGLVIAGVGGRSAAPPARSAQPGAGATSGDRPGLAEAPQMRDDIAAHDLQPSHVPDIPDADDRVM